MKVVIACLAVAALAANAQEVDPGQFLHSFVVSGQDAYFLGSPRLVTDGRVHEVTLSPDYSEGDGRWWYTRIEQDTTPDKRGGRFKVNRVKIGREQDDRHMSLAR